MPKRRENDPRRKFDTDALRKMGEALGWTRETVEDAPIRYTSENGFSGGPGGTHAVKESTDAIVPNVGEPNVSVIRKFPPKKQYHEN
jgi:hypothetical protein